MSRRSCWVAVALLVAATAGVGQDGSLAVPRVEAPIDTMGSKLRPVGLAYRRAAGIGLSTRLDGDSGEDAIWCWRQDLGPIRFA